MRKNWATEAALDNRRRRSQAPLPSVRLAALVPAALALLAPGCLKLKPVVLDQKTQLENQVLGAFQRLEGDLVLASSVRGGAAPPQLSPLEREAVEAMMRREFLRDEVEELKAGRVVGEANTGLLAILAEPGEAEEQRRVTALVAEENRCREVIMRRALQTGPGLSEKDLPLVKRIFYRLSLQTARPGELVQLEDGRWVPFTAPAAPAASPGEGSAPAPTGSAAGAGAAAREPAASGTGR